MDVFFDVEIFKSSLLVTILYCEIFRIKSQKLMGVINLIFCGNFVTSLVLQLLLTVGLIFKELSLIKT